MIDFSLLTDRFCCRLSSWSNLSIRLGLLLILCITASISAERKFKVKRFENVSVSDDTTTPTTGETATTTLTMTTTIISTTTTTARTAATSTTAAMTIRRGTTTSSSKRSSKNNRGRDVIKTRKIENKKSSARSQQKNQFIDLPPATSDLDPRGRDSLWTRPSRRRQAGREGSLVNDGGEDGTLLLSSTSSLASSRRQGREGAVIGDRGEERPTFRVMSPNVTTSPGERAVLRCRVDHLGTKTVTWRRLEDVHPLTIGLSLFVSDSRLSVDFSQRTGEWSLVIQDVRPTDEGYYVCQISTKEADIDNSYHVRLIVRKALRHPINPITSVHVTGSEYVERGDQIQLVCNATGRPEPPHDADWFKNGEKVHSDAEKGIIITKKIEPKMLISILVVRTSRMSDTGTYVCQSSTRDAARIDVQVLNVAPSVGKRGTASAKRSRTNSASASSKMLQPFLTAITSMTANILTYSVRKFIL